MTPSRRPLPGVLFSFLCALFCAPAALASGPDGIDSVTSAEELGRGRFIVRVFYEDPAQITALADFDVLEFNDREQRYVLLAATDEDLERLRTRGVPFQVDPDETRRFNRLPDVPEDQTSGIPGFPCYRTVEETYDFARKLAASRPHLASWTDVGDTWERTDLGAGFDLRVLRLTNERIPGPKPKLALTCSIHAREYTPAELCTRFAESLVDGWGVDADATWILDHHEVHVVLHANPDGRKQAETGLSWRKNTDQMHCSPTSNLRGADLNRNFEFGWGCCGGSSGSPCSNTYRGTSPASEPETSSVQEYLRSQFDDNRDADPGAAAPDDAGGVYIDIHSYSQLVLWPWGFPGTAPNDAQLTTLGRRLAWFNDYTPQQAIDLYPTDGTTIDFAYGELGLATFVFELGTEFFQDCDVFEGQILPDNLPALRYAARVARTPYVTPSGPDTLDVQVSPATAGAGMPRTLSATVDDTRFRQSNGTEPVHGIVAAEYTIDTPPWEAGATPQPLAVADGVFDAAVEDVTASIDTTGLAPGRHVVFVRGRDAAGVWGPPSAAFVDVDYTPGSVDGALTEMDGVTPLGGTVSVDVLDVEAAADPITGAYSLDLPPGSWTVRAAAADHQDRMFDSVVSEGASTPLDVSLAPSPPLLLVDDDGDAPDVRFYYTDVLDARGRGYVVWDTAVSGEPDAAALAAHHTVVWFTGADTGGTAGPSAAAEATLAAWLDGSRCLSLHGQDYYSDRGSTPFMLSRLGLDHGRVDVAEDSLTGLGHVFGPVGTSALAPPYPNLSDSISPAPGVDLGFVGLGGDAAIVRDAGVYRTTWLGFGLEALPASRRDAALSAMLAWCDGLPAVDGDGDGTANDTDCAPGDGNTWAAPSPAVELVVGASSTEDLSWSAPLDPGASTPLYDVLRAASADGFASASCVASGTDTTATTDAFVPAPGGVAAYLVRARNGCGDSIGADSSGTPRTGASCP